MIQWIMGKCYTHGTTIRYWKGNPNRLPFHRDKQSFIDTFSKMDNNQLRNIFDGTVFQNERKDYENYLDKEIEALFDELLMMEGKGLLIFTEG